MPRHIVLTTIMSLLLLGGTACTNNGQNHDTQKTTAQSTPNKQNQSNAQQQRIIIRFAESINPKDERLTQSLEQALDAKLSYLRTGSGQTHLYVCTSALSADELANKLNALGERSDVVYAELDYRRKPQ